MIFPSHASNCQKAAAGRCTCQRTKTLPSQATWPLRRLPLGMAASLKPNGCSSLPSTFWLGLYSGLMARDTFEQGIFALFANSFIPYARIALARAACRLKPSSSSANTNCRANSGSRRSVDSFSFQSRLRLLTLLPFRGNLAKNPLLY